MNRFLQLSVAILPEPVKSVDCMSLQSVCCPSDLSANGKDVFVMPDDSGLSPAPELSVHLQTRCGHREPGCESWLSFTETRSLWARVSVECWHPLRSTRVFGRGDVNGEVRIQLLVRVRSRPDTRGN